MEHSRLGVEKPPDTSGKDDGKKPVNMVQYETFESSSGDENEKCMFESQALSFQNKNQKVASSREKELKRIERLKRKEKKVNDKLKVKKETDRQDRNKERLRLKLPDINKDGLDDLDDDVIHFKDSDRESVMSYFRNQGV